MTTTSSPVLWTPPARVRGTLAVVTGREDDLVAQLARLADLTVVPHPDAGLGAGREISSSDALHAVLFDSGRPVLIAPPLPPATVGTRVCLAWNGTAESAAGVLAALPWLQRAQAVRVLSADEYQRRGPPASELAAYLAHHGVRPVEHMRRLGWTGDDVWYAHAVHLADDEVGLLARTGTGVCHCPSSNMRLASGIAPVRRCLAAGVRVGLGVDGSASNDGSNMLAEVRQAMLLARLRRAVAPGEDGWATAREMLEVATRGGAAVLGRADIGALEAGRRADFFTLPLDGVATAGALADPVAAAVFCAPQPARHVVVQGRPVVRDGALLTIDLPAVVREHNRHAALMRG